ncbi:MAG: hypothetical protein HY051_02005 [Candidatus Aenigmarchaeota archaeon]|nr:hypothetical protein [Candidatus Aenigmarchaeota archaeon]
MPRGQSHYFVRAVETVLSELINEQGAAYCSDIAAGAGFPEKNVITYLDSMAAEWGLLRGADSRGVYFEPAGIRDKKVLNFAEQLLISSHNGASVAQKDGEQIEMAAVQAMASTGKVLLTDVVTNNIRPAYAAPMLRRFAQRMGWIRHYDRNIGPYWMAGEPTTVNETVRKVQTTEEIMRETVERFRTATYELREIYHKYQGMNGIKQAVEFLEAQDKLWMKKYGNYFMERIISPETVTVSGMGERHIAMVYRKTIQESDGIISLAVAGLKRPPNSQQNKGMVFLEIGDSVPDDTFAIIGASRQGSVVIAETDNTERIGVLEDHSKPMNFDLTGPRFMFAFRASRKTPDDNNRNGMQKELFSEPP